jgi:hypothetical protein
LRNKNNIKGRQRVLSSRSEEYQLEETKNTKQSNGHSISMYPFNRLQLVIFVSIGIENYEKDKKGYPYILCIMWIFKVVTLGCIHLKTKVYWILHQQLKSF